ncbi:MAG: (2Fe-2S) ferredoxin domain-containing protein [Calditrichaeota bacterium]|nr:(2Fe-2S) ferredoxin domain-containing protein [Calditrichota bacterium]
MENAQKTPYTCHIFVCTNDRQGRRRSCADDGGVSIREELKQRVRENGWNEKVRVSQSGCLGQCEKGPNVMIYPQNLWFSHVTQRDIGSILEQIEKSLTL